MRTYIAQFVVPVRGRKQSNYIITGLYCCGGSFTGRPSSMASSLEAARYQSVKASPALGTLYVGNTENAFPTVCLASFHTCFPC